MRSSRSWPGDFLGGDQFLTGVVTASRRRDLVLELDGGRAQALELLHGPGYVDGVAVSCVRPRGRPECRRPRSVRAAKRRRSEHLRQ